MCETPRTSQTHASVLRILGNKVFKNCSKLSRMNIPKALLEEKKSEPIATFGFEAVHEGWTKNDGTEVKTHARITLKEAEHKRLKDEDAVTYSKGSDGDALGGLTDGAIYFVKRVPVRERFFAIELHRTKDLNDAIPLTWSDGISATSHTLGFSACRDAPLEEWKYYRTFTKSVGQGSHIFEGCTSIVPKDILKKLTVKESDRDANILSYLKICSTLQYDGEHEEKVAKSMKRIYRDIDFKKVSADNNGKSR